MGVIITFPDGDDWYVSGIYFGELVKDYARLFPHDREMQRELGMIAAVGGIRLIETEPELATKLLGSLENLAEAKVGEVHPDGTESTARRAGNDVTLRVMRKLLDHITRNKG